MSVLLICALLALSAMSQTGCDVCWIEIYQQANYGGQMNKYCEPTALGDSHASNSWKIKPGCTVTMKVHPKDQFQPETITRNQNNSDLSATDENGFGDLSNTIYQIQSLGLVSANPCQIPASHQRWGVNGDECMTFDPAWNKTYNYRPWLSNWGSCDSTLSWDLRASDSCAECGDCTASALPPVPQLAYIQCIDASHSEWKTSDNLTCIHFHPGTLYHEECTVLKGLDGRFAYDACPYSCKKEPCGDLLWRQELEHIDAVNTLRREGYNCPFWNSDSGYRYMDPVQTDLVLDCKLVRVARNHSKNMAFIPFMEHEDPWGNYAYDRCLLGGTTCEGENLHGGSYYGRSACLSLRDSNRHCTNQMKASYTRWGIGISMNLHNIYVNLWTQVFDGQNDGMNSVDRSCVPPTQPEVLPNTCVSRYAINGPNTCWNPILCDDGTEPDKVNTKRDCCGNLDLCPKPTWAGWKLELPLEFTGMTDTNWAENGGRYMEHLIREVLASETSVPLVNITLDATPMTGNVLATFEVASQAAALDLKNKIDGWDQVAVGSSMDGNLVDDDFGATPIQLNQIGQHIIVEATAVATTTSTSTTSAPGGSTGSDGNDSNSNTGASTTASDDDDSTTILLIVITILLVAVVALVLWWYYKTGLCSSDRTMAQVVTVTDDNGRKQSIVMMPTMRSGVENDMEAQYTDRTQYSMGHLSFQKSQRGVPL